jgi:hypothetical protein
MIFERGRQRSREGGHAPPNGEKLEKLLTGLKPVDVPPFFRTRLLARLREESALATPLERILNPKVAWAVAAVCVVALVVVLVRVNSGGPMPGLSPDAGEFRMADGAAAMVEPVMPAENSVVGARSVEIVAAISPPIEGGLVRLYVDDRDVTNVSEVTDSYVMYTPGEGLDEGEHIVTIEIRDSTGRKLKDYSWLFYAMNGGRAEPERRI